MDDYHFSYITKLQQKKKHTQHPTFLGIEKQYVLYCTVGELKVAYSQRTANREP
jgi:hypothetical protein